MDTMYIKRKVNLVLVLIIMTPFIVSCTSIRLLNCLNGINIDELHAFTKRLEQNQAELKALCLSGNETGVMAKARSMTQEILSNRTLQATLKCNEETQNNLQGDISDNSLKSYDTICRQYLSPKN